MSLEYIGICRYDSGMEELVLVAKALSDPSRVRILRALRSRELCVCELCDALGVTQSTLSTHLQVIRAAGLVCARKEGKWMYYAIAPAGKRMLNALFQSFDGSLKADATIRRDAKRLNRRLALRDDGACCVGFDKKSTCCSLS
jgi:ArsR family transcriptional regulator